MARRGSHGKRKRWPRHLYGPFGSETDDRVRRLNAALVWLARGAHSGSGYCLRQLGGILALMYPPSISDGMHFHPVRDALPSMLAIVEMFGRGFRRGHASKMMAWIVRQPRVRQCLDQNSWPNGKAGFKELWFSGIDAPSWRENARFKMRVQERVSAAREACDVGPYEQLSLWPRIASDP